MSFVVHGALWPCRDIYLQCHSVLLHQPLGLMTRVTGLAVSILNEKFMYNVLRFWLVGMNCPQLQLPHGDVCGKNEESPQDVT